MILPRTTLFHTGPPSTTQQPPASAPSSESWSFTTSLPVSYRVAIFLDASILLFTLAILIGAVLYIRNRRPAPHNLNLPHNHNHNRNGGLGLKPRSRASGGILRHSMGSVEEEETLLQSKEIYSDDRAVPQMSERLRSRSRSKSKSKSVQDEVEEGGAAVGGSVKGAGEKKKKGHVRWTPSVQGGEAFGISGVGRKGRGVYEKRCNCRGRRHPGCWRYEMKFEGGKPVVGETEEGYGRERGR
ncbi:hypothetical protein ACEPPN_000246 [Leptodophora sp. 'Broadleaf-Isolate-01']